MRMPTRRGAGEGSTNREAIDRCTGSIRRGSGNGTLEERSRLSGETRAGEAKASTASQGRRPERESDRAVVASSPGNSGGAKGPDFRRAFEES